MSPAAATHHAEVARLLAEIDENLICSELSDLERSEHIAARKGWYEAQHSDAAAGARRAAGMNRAWGANVAADSAATVVADTAAKTGVCERTIRDDVQIGESVPEDVPDALRDTPLADSKIDLVARVRQVAGALV
jgi:hypothetical protein